MFSDWMQSLGCHVHDMAKPDEEEAINADPEGWVQDTLTTPDVKVAISFEYPTLLSMSTKRIIIIINK
jgi:hypothetical protein